MAKPTPTQCKTCGKCGNLKPLDQFRRRSDGAGGGYTSHCVPCLRATAQERYWDGRARPPEQPPAPEGSARCSKCGEVKPLSMFGSRGEGRPHRGDCKPCVARTSKERYRNDPQLRAKHKALRDRWRGENSTYRQAYYQQNREKHLAYVAEYARLNPPDPERRRELERARRAADPERLRAQDAAWRAANPELARELSSRSQRRRRARMRALPVEPYTVAEIFERDGTVCVLCGDELDLTAVWPESLAPTIEHLECISWPDSAGDVLSNVALSHFLCNTQRNIRPHPAAARKRAELLALLT